MQQKYSAHITDAKIMGDATNYYVELSSYFRFLTWLFIWCRWLRDFLVSVLRKTPTATFPPKIGQLGPFKEVKVLGEGGYGTVYEVEDNGGLHYALKQVQSEIGAEEASILSLMSGSGVVRFLGHAVDKGVEGNIRTNLLLGLCTGCLLNVVQKAALKGEALTIDFISKVLRDVCTALERIHGLGYCHWDVKLDNILYDPLSGSWVLCDFGSASKPVDVSALGRSELMNLADRIETGTTILYRPPEMVDLYRKEPLGPAVDMWMIGCVLYALINHQLPFGQSMGSSVTLSILSGRVERREMLPLGSTAGHEKLLNVTYELLAVNPSERPTATELLKKQLLTS